MSISCLHCKNRNKDQRTILFTSSFLPTKRAQNVARDNSSLSSGISSDLGYTSSPLSLFALGRASNSPSHI